MCYYHRVQDFLLHIVHLRALAHCSKCAEPKQFRQRIQLAPTPLWYCMAIHNPKQWTNKIHEMTYHQISSSTALSCPHLAAASAAFRVCLQLVSILGHGKFGSLFANVQFFAKHGSLYTSSSCKGGGASPNTISHDRSSKFGFIVKGKPKVSVKKVCVGTYIRRCQHQIEQWP